MLRILRSLWLGVVLIAAASALLLYLDLGRRTATGKPAPEKARPRVAILQWVSTDLLDSVVAGQVEGLRQGGYVDGETVDLVFRNASGDNSTGNTMARELADGGYDLVLTASTLALQAVAQANGAGRTIHLFGGVTDPYGAGVGITGPGPDEHPPHLAGVGTFQPVERAFDLAKAMNPALASVGVVWSAGESNSEACVIKAREACERLGIELLEANAGTTSEVPEAVRAVLARGAEAVWIGGDTVAMSSIGAIVSAANGAKVPVFTNDPSDPPRGALFGVGASYFDVGLAVGTMAAQVLDGVKPGDFGVENLAPEVLALNEDVAAGLPGWSIPEAARAAAAESAARLAATATAPEPEPGREYKVALLQFVAHPALDDGARGVLDGLAKAGFVEGKNLRVKRANPGGDMSMLPQIARQLADEELDLLVPLTTPCLGAVLAVPRRMPVVFAMVTSPVQAGAGATFEDHLPDVTGVVWTAPSPDTFTWLEKALPGCRRVGVVYNPADASSLDQVAQSRAAVEGMGKTLVEATVNATTEVAQAVQSLAAKDVDAVLGLSDNTVVSAAAAFLDACRKEKLPVTAADDAGMGDGALFSCGLSPYAEGLRGGALAARVLAGEYPANLPFLPGEDFELSVDLAAFRDAGLTPPPKMLSEARKFYHVAAVRGRPARVALVSLAQNPLLESAEKGLLAALGEAGLAEGTDFTVKRFNAAGELAQLPGIIEAARTDRPDLLVTLATPTMMAAVKAVKDIPIVFTVTSDPAAVGLFEADQRPANVTGVHDNPPMDRLLEMALRHEPGLEKVGIVYDPSQPNALVSVERLRVACAARGCGLEEATANTVADLGACTQALIERGAGAITLSADNLVATGFPSIAAAARRDDIPIYTTDADLVEQGAVGAVGYSYEGWGAQTGLLAARVLAGASPADLPLEEARVDRVTEPAARPGKARPKAAAAPDRPWEVRIVRYNDAQFSADAARGILDSLTQQGLTEGVDFNLGTMNAQGDISTLASILVSVKSEAPDVVLPISTPALQATLRQIEDYPVVFTCVADAVAAGAGESLENHRPNVTGVTTRSPFVPMAEFIRDCVPGARAVGTLFTPSEVNSELYRTWFEEALVAVGLELKSVPVMAMPDIPDATAALLREDIQVLAQVSDNLTRPAFGQLAQRAEERGIPFFCFDSAGMSSGATVALARDYYEAGVEAGVLATRILGGESPADIPFAPTPSQLLRVDPALLQRFGVVLTPEWQAKARPERPEAKQVTPSAPDRPWEVRLVRYNDALFSEEAERGVLDGLREAAGAAGAELHASTLNAQGDMSTLASIIVSVRAEQPDVVIPISTPALQAALRQIEDIPVVFTSVADGVCAGAGESNERHRENVTGVTLPSPFESMCRLIRACMPRVRRVGTLYSPSEVNSELYRDRFEKALAAVSLELVAVPVMASSEVPQGTSALLAKDIQLVAQISDNTTRPGIAQLARRCEEADIPLFCFDSTSVDEGAALALARDHYEAGRAAASKAARVVQGESPRDMPFEPTAEEVFRADPERLTRYGIRLTDDWKQRLGGGH